VLYAVIATLLIPAAVTFVPSFVLVSTLGWVSTLRGLIVPGLFQAFATFLFRQYFLGFPREIEDAARIDGLGFFGTFWRVVLPNSLGFVAAIGTITFIGSWNAFLWPLVIGQDQNAWTVQIALSTFSPSRRATCTSCSWPPRSRSCRCWECSSCSSGGSSRVSSAAGSTSSLSVFPVRFALA
jgi:ABC-type glycerol-3-phosphate transport system permease component